MSDSEKISDLLDQKIEEQAHFLDNTHSLLAYGKIPSSIFLLTKTISFYARNFLRIFLLSNLFFILIAASFISQLVYFHIPINPIIIPALLILLYVCTFANLVLEEENGIFISIKYGLVELLPTVYSCFIFIFVIFGFAVLAFIPKFIITIFLPDTHLFTIVGNVIFAILSISIVVWYSLFLFVSVDESKYGFKSLFRSKAYVGVNFPDFLRRLVVCVAVVPVVFTVMDCVVEGILVGLDMFNDFFSMKYDRYYDLSESLEDKLRAYGISIVDQYVILQSWFIKIVFVIPFLTIYLGFLYSTLSCENPLSPSFSGSRFHKILLGLFFITGAGVMFILYKAESFTNIIKLFQ